MTETVAVNMQIAMQETALWAVMHSQTQAEVVSSPVSGQEQEQPCMPRQYTDHTMLTSNELWGAYPHGSPKWMTNKEVSKQSV